MDRRESTNESLEKNSKPYILTQIKSFNEHILTVSFRIMSSKNEQGEITLESEMFMNFKVTQRSTCIVSIVLQYIEYKYIYV